MAPSHRWQHLLLWTLSGVLIIMGAWLTYASLPILTAGGGGSDAGSLDSSSDPTASSSGPAVNARSRPLALAVPSALPRDLEDALQGWLGPTGRIVTDTQQADLWLTIEPSGEPLVERVYVPVARFTTIQEEVSAPDLLALWLGNPSEGQQPLVVDADTASALHLLWGEPAQVEIVPDVAAVGQALSQDAGRLGIVPFDQLVPELHPLAIAGNTPIHKDFDADGYPLTLWLYLNHTADSAPMAASLQNFVNQSGLRTNRDPARMTVLIMTGVTAMSRLTAQRMEQEGYDYPAQVVGPVLAEADLTHISNEVPFVPDCQVDTSLNNVVLCSKPEYLAALRLVGADLVGLTGNHLNDFGQEASLGSLQFYENEGLKTYGGGANSGQASKPLIIEHNDNRLAFLGANSFGPPVAWATEDSPGAATYNYEAMAAAIKNARETQGADLVLVELQWEESYDTMPIQSQRQGFPLLSTAGADIVTGVQSHVPQAIGFAEGRLILYGLGNLFFDQMWSLPTRQSLVPRHVFYDGRHLSTELLVTVLEDYAQPRWAGEAEREDILQRVFTASGW